MTATTPTTKNKGKNKGHANLIPIKKGERRNPNGRPVGQKNYATLYREALLKLAKSSGKDVDQLEVDMLVNAFTRAHAGDYRFYKDILDRTHGTALQKTSISVTDDIPDSAITDKVRAVTEKFEEEMRKLLTSKPK